MKILILFASSRDNGNTRKALDEVVGERKLEIIDLAKKNITPYDYQNRNRDDDFMGIAEKMAKSDIIIFATPVYWYTMSAQLKTFFDRFTDLISIRKDLGRRFKGKICYVLSTGSDSLLPPGFESPIAATCGYMDMVYKGAFYCPVGKDGAFAPGGKEKAKELAEKLFN